MADVNGGSLSFTSVMDNEKMNAAIEETLRRVQGFSDAVVGGGDAMDETTRKIVESINIQKRGISELENTVAELNNKINSVEPGAAQDTLIEQANAARAELEVEKQGMVALINELNNLQRANEGVASSSEKIRAGLGQIGAACEMHEKAILALRAEWTNLNKAMDSAPAKGDRKEFDAMLERINAIKGEIETRKALFGELREQSDALEAEAGRMERARAAAENTAQAHVSLRSRIRELREEMALYREKFGDQTEKYREMSAELGRLQDIQGDIAQQGRILSNDEAQFQGVISGLNGIVGGFTAAQGAVALFAGENDNLQKIMLKVQSLMSITMGLQQVSQTVNKDSAFSLVTLNKAKEWWNKLLDIGRGKQIADTAALESNTAAQGVNAAATGKQAVTATAGTAANIGLAGAFRMVGAAIKSIPAFGWIAAALTALIAVIGHFINKAKEAKEAQAKLVEQNYKMIGSINELSEKWKRLGNDMEGKNKLIKENQKTFEEYGVVVRKIADAENLLIKNKPDFVNAQIAKAQSLALLQSDRYQNAMKKSLEARLKLEDATTKWDEKVGKRSGREASTMKDFKYSAKNGKITSFGAPNASYDMLKAMKDAKEAEFEMQKIYVVSEGLRTKHDRMMDSLNRNALEKHKRTVAGRKALLEQELEDLKTQRGKLLATDIKAIKEYDKRIKAKQAQIGKLEPGNYTSPRTSPRTAPRTPPKTDKDPFLEKLAKRKSEYARFMKLMNSGDKIIQKAAATEFEGFLKQGATYIDYLKKQRDIILQVDVAGRTKEQNKQLRQLNDAIAEETKKTVLEAFNNELSESLDNAKSVIEALNIVEQKRKKLSGDGTELDNAKKDALDEAGRQIQKKAIQQTEALLSGYASFTEQKRRLDEQYRVDKELLDRRLAKATSAAEIAEIKKVMAEREKKHDKDVSNVGGYDDLLNQYGGYEQKKTRIQEQYAERRRIAELNGNKDLLAQLAQAEQDELSKLQSDLIKNSGDWQNLFGNLDELTTKTIKRLITKIEGMKATIGVDLNPQDWKEVTDQLEKARSEAEKRNLFTALGASLKRLKEAIKDGKGLGSDEAKKAIREVATAVSGSIDIINGTFNAVTDGLQKMGIEMDEETQAMLGDLGDIMEGVSQLSEGIAKGNPLSVIRGSIGLLSSAFDLFNSRDRKAEKQVKKHQAAIKELQNSYRQLEWQIDKALGGEVYKNQQAAIRNMQEQQAHLKASWEAEERKKKTDRDRVDEFKEQYAELGRQIEDMIDEISNDLLQTTAKDFANDLGDALVEAFSKGEDAAKAMETTVNSVLKNLVVNQLKKEFLETQLQGALDQLQDDMGYWNGDNFIFDGLSDAEIDRFKQQVATATGNFNQALDVYKGLFADLGLDDTDTSLTGAVKGVSEETANILAGQMNAIRINQLDGNEVLRQSLQALNTIACNTAYNKYLSRIERIITIMESNNTGNTLRSQGLS